MKDGDDALGGSEAKFRALLESAPDGIVIVDARGHMVLVNGQTEKMFGYSRDDLLGQPAPSTRPMGVGLDLQGRRRDGTTFPVEISLSPLQTGLLVTSVIRDVTARKEADTRIHALNRDLEQRVAELGIVNRELEAFSYSVSHDLRAPPRAIDGFSQALLDDLLDLSRVTRREMQHEPVDLTAPASAIGAQLQRSEPGRRVELSVAPGLRARGDPHLLRLVLENLLGNAWKFTSTSRDAQVEFGATSADGAIAYFVRDNGVGFDMAYADKLFGRSSGYTPRTSSQVPVSVWPPSSGSFIAMAAASGRRAPSAGVRRSTSRSDLTRRIQTWRAVTG